MDRYNQTAVVVSIINHESILLIFVAIKRDEMTSYKLLILRMFF